MGTVAELRPEPPGCRLIVRERKIAAATRVADSISVNGCCLTVIECDAETFAFEAGPETLARTNLGELKPGSRVNLERRWPSATGWAATSSAGTSTARESLLLRDDCGEWSTFWFSVPRELAVQMASKGLIAVHGISLTIVGCEPDRFSVALIPYTLAVTTLGPMRIGDRVNLETDLLAKYVQRLVEAKQWKADA